MSEDFDETVRRMERAAQAGAPLDAWFEDPDAVTRLARQAGPLFGRVLENLAGEMPAPGPIAPPELIGAAVVRADGRVVLSDTRFDAWLGPDAVDAAIVARVAAARGSMISVGAARDGAPVAMAYGDASHVLAWTLPEDVKRALAEGRGKVGVVAVCPSRAGEVLARASAAYGLTAAQARLAAALVQTGDIDAAARALGVQTSTARRTLVDVMRALGVRKQSALISRIATTALGYWPHSASDPALLIDAFGLSTRQANIALGLARGLSRKDAGRAAGVSEAVAKDEIERIYQSLGVGSMQMLSRLVTETMALGVLAQVSNGELAPTHEDAEPLRLIPRPAGGMIAISDYGPASGAPVLVLHSSSTTRHASRSFVRGLQEAGYRPIAIDRPGFGMTDMTSAEGDPFAAAADDMVVVCEALGLARVDLMARGGAYAAHAFAQRRPDMTGMVVCLNPDAATLRDDRPGMLGAITGAILLHPDRLAYFARILTGEATAARVARLLRQVLRSSPPDLAAFDDPAAVADYQRAVRHFATGHVAGFIAEQRALANAQVRGPLAHSDNWRILIGAHDPLHTTEEALAHWRVSAPSARFQTIKAGGRFLFLTHLPAVIDALRV